MAMTLDQLQEAMLRIKRLVCMDDAAFSGALSAGFEERTPANTANMPAPKWAEACVRTLRADYALLMGRFPPPTTTLITGLIVTEGNEAPDQPGGLGQP